MELHDGTIPLTAASQKIPPKPKGGPVHEVSSDFFILTHIIVQFYVTMALHSSHITNFDVM